MELKDALRKLPFGQVTVEEFTGGLIIAENFLISPSGKCMIGICNREDIPKYQGQKTSVAAIIDTTSKESFLQAKQELMEVLDGMEKSLK